MNYIDFMRKVEGRPPRPKVDTSGFYYTGRMLVRVNCIRGVLSGGYRRIGDAFTWLGTPQGYTHWLNVEDGETQLTPADVQYLEWMLEEYS
jgi:hypothetical protein